VPRAQETTQVPPCQVPAAPVVTLQTVPAAFGWHVPFLQRFLPFFFWHLPLSHRSHSPHFGLHVPDLAASVSPKPG